MLGAAHFRKEFMGFNVPRDIYIHICGTDLIRDNDGRYLVLEDNGRCPSGVSYVLENRQAMKRVFPRLFAKYPVRPVDDYAQSLLNLLRYIAPEGRARGPDGGPADAGRLQLGVLRAFLSGALDGHRDRGGPRPRGRAGRRVHADDQGPQARGCNLPAHRRRFPRPGGVPAGFVPGRAGHWSTPTGTARVSLANSIGTGVADDKVMYYFVPRMIKFYLGEEPILPNVETYLSSEEKDRAVHPGQPGQTGRQGRQRERRLRDAHRHAGEQGADRKVPRTDHRQSAQLHRAAGDFAVAFAGLRATIGMRPGRPAHRPAAVHSLRREGHDHCPAA